MCSSHPETGVYDNELAAAKLTALRALLDIINTTDDESEKRQAATVIMRTKEPLASARGNSARTPQPHRQPAHPNPAPQHARHPSHAPEPASPPENWTIDTGEIAETFDIANVGLPDLPSIFPHRARTRTAAAKIAAIAGAIPPQPRAGSP